MMVPAWHKVDLAPERSHPKKTGLSGALTATRQNMASNLYPGRNIRFMPPSKKFVAEQIIQTTQKGGHLHPCRQPPLFLCCILFSQSLKTLSSSLSIVPALANSSVSA